MRILETPTAYLSPLQHLAKVGKELLVKITRTRITNIGNIKIEPESILSQAQPLTIFQLKIFVQRIRERVIISLITKF